MGMAGTITKDVFLHPFKGVDFMKKCRLEPEACKTGWAIIIWILVFQNPLQTIWNPFSYIDEVIALIGACLGLFDILVVRKGRPSKDQLWMGIPLLMFTVIGLTGNLIYRYQPLKCVIIDLFTNLKFFFAIGAGYYLFISLDWEEIKTTAQRNGRMITLCLFALFLADRIFHIWPSEVRYGIPSAVLIYAHPTYLAGAMSFLLMLLTVFYDKKNKPYLAMAVGIMAFTFRAKAVVSAVMYILMYVFFLLLNWRLKLWHVVVAGAGSIAIAWEKIRYYFVDLAGTSARSILLQKSFLVMRDHFPIGSGFGTYGSAEAAEHYSSVYIKYGLNNYYDTRDVRDIENSLRLIQKSEYHAEKFKTSPDRILYHGANLMDHFWPTVFGQTGALGTIVYVSALGVLVKRCLDIENYDLYAYTGSLFALLYLFVSSLAEPAFFNAVAVPLALVMGIVFCYMDKVKHDDIT